MLLHFKFILPSPWYLIINDAPSNYGNCSLEINSFRNFNLSFSARVLDTAKKKNLPHSCIIFNVIFQCMLCMCLQSVPTEDSYLHIGIDIVEEGNITGDNMILEKYCKLYLSVYLMGRVGD